jgi:uncharacterized protein YndB with AHSA1/START domain
MPRGLLAHSTVTIDASLRSVWDALIDPEKIRQYMFGTHVDSNWTSGSAITWRGEFQGKSYEDKGTILEIDPGRLLQYTHYSSLAGQPDAPENYHTVTIELFPDGQTTRVALSQDNNPTSDAQHHSEKSWQAMLDGLKQLLEK